MKSVLSWKKLEKAPHVPSQCSRPRARRLQSLAWAALLWGTTTAIASAQREPSSEQLPAGPIAIEISTAKPTPVNPRVYGINCEEMFMKDLVDLPEYIEALMELKFKTFLYPGGSITYYHHPKGSGGGSLVLELAAETPLCAVTAQEPATVLFTGILSLANLPKPGDPQYREKWQSGTAPVRAMMADPQRYYTPELQKFTEEKIRKINCPVLIAHGDKHPINKLNNEIFVPALKAAGKQVEVILYPGENHSFSYRGTPAMTKKFFHDCDAFFRRHLSTQPKPLDRALITEVPVE